MKRGLKTRGTGASKIRAATLSFSRRCNICSSEFHPSSVFSRYCSACKNDSELLKFSEWLPQVDEEIQERISA